MQAQTITGKAFNQKQQEEMSFASVGIKPEQAKNSNENYLFVMADARGHFKLADIKPGLYSIKLSSLGLRDTVFNNITIVNDTSINLDYFDYCQYDAAKKHRTCPVCNKKDQVIPIRYGFPISTNGEDPLKDDGKKYLLAGCEITGCDPNWYCKRDKKSF